MAAFNVGGVNFRASVMNKDILVIVIALFQIQITFPIMGVFVVSQFGFVFDLPVGELAKNINVAVGDGKIAFKRETGVNFFLRCRDFFVSLQFGIVCCEGRKWLRAMVAVLDDRLL